MKLTTFLLLFAVIQTMGFESFSQGTKISLNFKNTSLKEVLGSIEDKTEYYFLYSSKVIDVDRKIDVDINGKSISEALVQILKNTDIEYVFRDRQILLSSKSNQDKLFENIQQQKSVSGKVTDSTGSSLPGVSVVVKGTTVGTITDSDGKYTLANVPANATLLFSFVGMKTQEIIVGSKTKIDVTLADEAIGIDEVVAIGYGTQKKSDITGSLVSIKTEDLKHLATQRVDQALQGKSAGVMVLNTDGAPGGNTLIRIRGMGSILGGNNPLIVIDGQNGGNLNTLDPNDIESLEVLKDASSTAIYGSKGANGVILITTKSGKKGQPVVSYKFNYNVQHLRKKLDLMKAGDYARTINDYRSLNNLSGTPSPIFTESQISDFDKNGGTDWQDEIYKVAPMQSHSVGIGGGSENITYYFSSGYLSQEGIVINSDYNRLNLLMNIHTNVNKWLSAGLKSSLIRSVGSVAPFGGYAGFINFSQPILQAPLWGATTPVYDVNGNYSKAPSGYGNPMSWNPVATALETDVKNSTTESSVNGYFDFKISKNLVFKVLAAANFTNQDNRIFSNEKTYNGRLNQGKEGEGIIRANNSVLMQNTNILSFNKEFNSHKLNLTAVAEQQIESYKNNSLTATGFTVLQTGLNDLGSSRFIVNGSGASKRVLNSYLGRINYSYNNKYLLTASYRTDGSSVFGKNNKWGYFPSIALAWRLTEEKFIKNLTAISDLKLRISKGKVGNQGISPYQTLAALRSGQNYPYNGSKDTDLGFVISRASNPNLKWESTTSTNLGLDYGLFKGRLSGSIDLYKKTTTDLLLNRDLARYTGLGSIIDNIGSIENKGLEIVISGDPFIKTFKWNSAFNVSFNRNKVLEMGTTKKLLISAGGGGYGAYELMWLYEGEPFGQMYGYVTKGLWKESEKSAAAIFGQLPGETHYVDLNLDGKINILDRQPIGNSNPKFVFGWANHFSYHGIELNLVLQGVYGNDVFNMSRIRIESPGEGTSVALLNRWTLDNQDTNIPAFIDARTYQNSNLVNKIGTTSADRSALDRYVEDGSYLRLKNIMVAYNIPSILTSKLGIRNLKAFISSTNLITLTKYSGYDPEVSSFNDSDAALGVDLGNYPTATTYTLGIELSF